LDLSVSARVDHAWASHHDRKRQHFRQPWGDASVSGSKTTTYTPPQTGEYKATRSFLSTQKGLFTATHGVAINYWLP